jgi:Ca-activated chloride channel family protein
VLITDGANNAGEISPVQAAEAAKALGVRVHTIGLSSADTFSVALNGVWTVRNVNARLSGRDEAVLKDIATRTGGQFYKATDPNMLTEVLKEIDPLERIPVDVNETREWHELFPTIVGIGIALLLLEMLLRMTWLRALP